jgi:hypothetical protein
MADTVANIVSQASLEIGIALQRVDDVANSIDQDVVQLGALINAVADELLVEQPYRDTMGDGCFVIDKNGVPQRKWANNDDVVMFDTRLTIDGLKFRFLQGKGLEFAEQMRDFANRLNKVAGRANGRVLDLDTDAGREV